MIELTKGKTSEKVLVTLDELKLLNTPYYLFVFHHVTTKSIVTLIKASTEDESEYPERYNQFDFNTLEAFENAPVGEWHYKVYEQESETNTDPAQAYGEVERGKMILNAEEAFDFVKYDNPVTYKAYNG